MNSFYRVVNFTMLTWIPALAIVTISDITIETYYCSSPSTKLLMLIKATPIVRPNDAHTKSKATI